MGRHPDQPRQHEFSPSSVVVVVVPYPAQSHLNQLLQLAHVISSYDIPVHYVGSPLNNSRVKSRASNPLYRLTEIHFHDFPTPSLPSSPTNWATKFKFPEHSLFCWEVTTHLRVPVAALLRSLSPTARRLVVVYDILMASVVQDVVSLPNTEAYSLNTSSVLSCVVFGCEALGMRDKIPVKDIPSTKSSFPSVYRNFIAFQGLMSYSKSGELHNTYRAIEGSFAELLAHDKNSRKKKTWAMGPLPQNKNLKELRNQDKSLMEWLEKQEPKSVLYVSFGTTTTFSDNQIKELALGLEQSRVKFLWVLRDADRLDASSNEEERRTKLPYGFEERTRERGIVVREWVPQVEILGHPSTGGFMSHCGWNSCIESISMGVPIATWPMHFDQPTNAALITKVLKVGVAVVEWRQRDDLVNSSLISKAVIKLMASEEGDEIRRRVVEMSEEIKHAVAEGGDCRLEWDCFVSHITREATSLENHKIRRFGLKVINSVIEFSIPFIELLMRF
ncbi:UDP-glucuronosyl/UDP-glucosyltransferase [Trema orientale]|uniref:Glycosyltransferase n=1 Tax=Trema orientale TaxID=63057 RepID=A0A2P5AY69_TREOI|nr:UDP-glucuronosyl/UDP-glucosyltransferase [Trema orientale]